MDARTFDRLRLKFDLVPVARPLGTLPLDLIELFERLAADEAALYEDNRFSYAALSPRTVVSLDRGRADALETLRENLAPLRVHRSSEMPPFFGGAIGFLGYGVAGWLETLPDRHPALPIPEAKLLTFNEVIAIERATGAVTLVSTRDTFKEAQDHLNRLESAVRERPAPRHAARGTGHESNWSSNCTRAQFLDAVRSAKEDIAAGETFQIVVSQRWETPFPASGAVDLYRALRELNPSPYMFLIRTDECTLVGASPEMLVRVSGDLVETRPIAGTRARGKTPEDDAKLQAELLADEKENAEHLMLVDLGRNDVGRVSERGSVRVTEFRAIERYSHVMHIVSHVTGRLKDGLAPVDALLAAFPAGTVTGAPKIRAMEIIDELEFSRRGPYAGAVVVANYAGDLDSAITIRTVLLHNERAYVQAGAGIVFDSVPEREYEETVNKAAAMKAAIEKTLSEAAGPVAHRDTRHAAGGTGT